MKQGKTIYTKNSLDQVIECKFVSQEGDIVFMTVESKTHQKGTEISRHIQSTAKTAELADNI